MKILVREDGADRPTPARIIETARGREVRGKRHLLGVLDASGHLEIKLGDEFLIVREDSMA